MRGSELATGRTFAARFGAGESFFPALDELCREHGIRRGYIPMFPAAFAEADTVGTCDKLDDPAAPVWSKAHLANAEALGCGTIAWDEQEGRVLPHAHTTLGLKEHSATGYTSHLLAARVQFLVEIIVVEVTPPARHDPPARPRHVRRPPAHLRKPPTWPRHLAGQGRPRLPRARRQRAPARGQRRHREQTT